MSLHINLEEKGGRHLLSKYRPGIEMADKL